MQNFEIWPYRNCDSWTNSSKRNIFEHCSKCSNPTSLRNGWTYQLVTIATKYVIIAGWWQNQAYNLLRNWLDALCIHCNRFWLSASSMGPRSSSRTIISISLNSMSLNFSQLWSLKKKRICRTMEKIKHHTMSPGHPYTMRSTMWSSCIFTPYDQMVCDAHTESWCRPLDLRKLHAKHSWRLWLVGRPGLLSPKMISLPLHMKDLDSGPRNGK